MIHQVAVEVRCGRAGAADAVDTIPGAADTASRRASASSHT